MSLLDSITKNLTMSNAVLCTKDLANNASTYGLYCVVIAGGVNFLAGSSFNMVNVAIFGGTLGIIDRITEVVFSRINKDNRFFEFSTLAVSVYLTTEIMRYGGLIAMTPMWLQAAALVGAVSTVFFVISACSRTSEA